MNPSDTFKSVNFSFLMVPACIALILSACADRDTPPDKTETLGADELPVEDNENNTQNRAVKDHNHDEEAHQHKVELRGDYVSVLPMLDLMTHVFWYSASGVWDRQGYIIDKNGQTSLFPQNEEEWEHAEEAAATLAELTNILLLPDRREDDEEWVEFVHKLRERSIEAMRAAEQHDEQKFLTAGSHIDEACESCHDVYRATAYD